MHLSIAANVRPLEVSITTYIGDPTTLAVDTDASVQTSDLKWRHNGEYMPNWDGLKTVYIGNTTAKDRGVYECYVTGMRQYGRHAIFILLVPGNKNISARNEVSSQLENHLCPKNQNVRVTAFAFQVNNVLQQNRDSRLNLTSHMTKVAPKMVIF